MNRIPMSDTARIGAALRMRDREDAPDLTEDEHVKERAEEEDGCGNGE